MNDRRRFLHVLGVSVLAAGCGGGSTPGANAAGTGGAGGSGAGGDGGGGDGSGGDAGSGGTGGSAPAENVCGLTGKNIVNVGTPADFPDVGLHKVLKTSVLIGRDENGLYARTSICTHMRCNMNEPKTVLEGGTFVTGGDIMPDGGVLCYCHNSRYRASGDVEMGPAVQPLAALALSLCDDGTLQVDTKTTVDAAYRVSA